MRTRMAESAVPSVRAGRTRLAAPSRPLTGSQPRRNEKRMISIGPSQKFGIETPTSEPTSASRSGRRSRRIGGEDADRQRDQQGDRHRRGGEQRRGRQRAADHREDRLAVEERAAEIAAGEPAEEARVLLAQRAVEAEVGAQLPEIGARGGLAEHQLHRVAGDQVHEEEDERQHPEHGRDEQEQPPADARHRRRPGPASGRCTARPGRARTPRSAWRGRRCRRDTRG